jgi:hypothetical protein
MTESRGSGATRIVVGGTLVVVLLVVSVGCMPPDRSDRARSLEFGIAGLPGVDNADVRYSNDFENGAELDVKMVMTHTSEQQIAAAASHLGAVNKSDFKGYRQYASFVVGDALTVQRDANLDPSQIVGDVHLLRELRAKAQGTAIKWSRYGTRSRLEVWETTQTRAVLAAALETLADDVTTTVYIRSAEPTKVATWEVDLPMDNPQSDAVRDVLTRLPLPAYYVHVDSGQIVGLNVYVGERETAFSGLKSVIHAVQPTNDHPLSLVWSQAHERDNHHRFTGSLEVPACPPAERSTTKDLAERNLTPDAVLLQRKLWQEFAQC